MIWLLVVLSLTGVGRFRGETDLTKIFNRDVPAVQTGERIQELFNLSFAPWVVVSESLEEARSVQRAFAEDPAYVRVEGAASLFPEEFGARAERLKVAGPILKARQAQLDFILATSSEAEPLPGGLSWDTAQQLARGLVLIQESFERGPPDVDALPNGLREGVRLPDGGWITLAYTRFTGLDGLAFRESRLQAQVIAPTAAGFGNFIEAGTLAPLDWAGQVFLGILFVVALVLAIDLRSFRWILLAIAPVASAVTITFGLLCWLDVGFTVLLVIVIPLLLGLGVDDGIHVVHRMREDPDLPASAAAVSVGRAIVMTTMTTCSTFFVLLFSNHPGIESMAWVMLLGLPLCLLGSVCLIPALAVLLGLRSAT